MGISVKTQARTGRTERDGAIRRRGGLAALTAAVLLAWPSLAAAEEVVLRTKDGAFQIQGELLSVENGFLTVRTSMGQVRVPMEQVTCTGPGCPPGLRSEEAAEQQDTATTQGPGSRTDLTIGISSALPQDAIGALVTAYDEVDGVTVVAAPDGRSWTVTTASGGFQLTAGDPGGADLRIETAAGVDEAGIRQVLALEPFIVATAPRSRPATLTMDMLADIFSGRTRDWASLNIRSGPIKPAVPEADPELEDFLRSAVLGARVPASTIIRVSNVPGYLFSTPGSIALVRGSLASGLRATPISGDCGLTAGVDPFAVRSGQYPLTRPVVIRAGGGDLAAPVQAFLDFAGTDAAQQAIDATGLTGQSIIPASRDWQADWIASAAKLSEFVGGEDAKAVLDELVRETANATRLSVTMRYVFSAEAPDTAARGDFARLAAAIASGAYDGNEILFIGFSDAGTAITQGRTTSTTAANRVLGAFQATHPAVLERPNIRFAATGFGGIAPLVCSGSAAERAINQRVEVWIRPL